MKISVNESSLVNYEVNFDYPFYRSHCSADAEIHTYYHFVSPTKVFIIVEDGNSTTLSVFDDPKTEIVSSILTGENMLYGYYDYDVIEPPVFLHALLRLQRQIMKTNDATQ